MTNAAKMATPLWSAAQAAQATGGELRGDWRADGVSIDSRTLVPGDLFVALKGPNHDGHDHVRHALDAHAAAAMVEQGRCHGRSSRFWSSSTILVDISSS